MEKEGRSGDSPWSQSECDRDLGGTEGDQELDQGGAKPQTPDTCLSRMDLLSWDCARECLGPHLYKAGGRSPQSPAAGCPESPSPCWVLGCGWTRAGAGAGAELGVDAVLRC